MIWSILNSDLDSRRKCAAVIVQLKGEHRNLYAVSHLKQFWQEA